MVLLTPGHIIDYPRMSQYLFVLGGHVRVSCPGKTRALDEADETSLESWLCLVLFM